MVEFDLPNPLTEEIVNLIPSNRLVTNKLLNKGKFQSYTLANDHSKLWIVVLAESELDVLNIISELPISDFLLPNIIPLAFHNTTSAWRMPAMSLN